MITYELAETSDDDIIWRVRSERVKGADINIVDNLADGDADGGPNELPCNVEQ